LIYLWKYWHVTTDLERDTWNLNWLICRIVSWLPALILYLQCQKYSVSFQIPPGELVYSELNIFSIRRVVHVDDEYGVVS
jgi:hypothetical protein